MRRLPPLGNCGLDHYSGKKARRHLSWDAARFKGEIMSLVIYGKHDWELDTKDPGRVVGHQDQRARRRRCYRERFGVATHPSHPLPTHHHVHPGPVIQGESNSTWNAAGISDSSKINCFIGVNSRSQDAPLILISA